MKKFDFTGSFKGLDGKSIIDEKGNNIPNINIYLGNALAMIKTKEPIRTITIAKKIFEEKAPSLEEADGKYILKLIKEKLNLPDLMYEQIRERIEK